MRDMSGKRGRSLCFREWKRKEGGRGQKKEGRRYGSRGRKRMGSKGGTEEVGKKGNGER
jgi:hypothetical protein